MLLFFDAAGTLFELTDTVGAHYAEVARRHGLDLDPPALDRAFRLSWRLAPQPFLAAGPREDDDRPWWRNLVADVFRQVDSPLSAACFDDLYHHFTGPGVWRLFPETFDVLDRLRRKHRLGIVSNFDRRLYPILGHLGIAEFFDPVVISSEAGADKPHPQIFEVALEKAGAKASDAMHIGDDPHADWAGAAGCGLQVFKLDRPRNSLIDLEEELQFH